MTPRVSILIQFSPAFSAEDEILIAQDGSADLIEIFEDAGPQFDMEILPNQEAFGLPLWFPLEEIPFQAVLQISLGDSAESIKKQGETITFGLIRLVRENILDSD
ncbi:MAG: hypothetical protein WEC37_01065 [Anaerolineales bacterium]